MTNELLSKVFGYKAYISHQDNNEIFYSTKDYKYTGNSINIYELAHLNLKQWAKTKDILDIIDWSGEPEQIFKKAEELRNELN